MVHSLEDMMKNPLRLAAFLAGISVASVLAAQPLAPQRYNVVELSANVQREVANDLMTAQLFAELSDPNPAQLANQLNRAVAEAVRVAKEYPQIKIRTGNNQTYPVYGRNNQAQGWRGRAELRLETRDFAAGAALVGKLQSGLQLGGIQFAISPEARQKVENELIAEAIAAFRARAEIARSALGGKSYKVQRLGVNAGGSAPSPRPMRAALASDMSVAAPPVEAGESVVTVSANGAVEID
jgi:predicted secreted protein